jgi:hypothetical protein
MTIAKNSKNQIDEIQQVIFELIVDTLKNSNRYTIKTGTQSIAIEVYQNSNKKKRMRIIIYISRQRLVIYDQNSSKAQKIEFFEPDFEQQILDTIQNIEQSND